MRESVGDCGRPCGGQMSGWEDELDGGRRPDEEEAGEAPRGQVVDALESEEPVELLQDTCYMTNGEEWGEGGGSDNDASSRVLDQLHFIYPFGEVPFGKFRSQVTTLELECKNFSVQNSRWWVKLSSEGGKLSTICGGFGQCVIH